MSLLPTATLADTEPLLRRHGVRATPMHPGVADDALSRWYLLDGSSEATLRAAIEELQKHPAVDAAMLKPGGEAPG